MYFSPTCQQILPVRGFEDGCTRVVNEPENDFAHIEWLPDIGID